MNMIWLRSSILLNLVVLTASARLWAAGPEGGYRVLAADKGKVAIVDAAGKVEWELPWGGIHDVHVGADGHIFVQQGPAKVVEIDPATKKVVWTYDSTKQNGNAGKPVEVHAFQPLGEGRMMIAESGPGRIIEIDRDGKLLHELKLKVNRPHPHTVRNLEGLPQERTRRRRRRPKPRKRL